MTHLTSLVQLHSRLDWPFFSLCQSHTNILYSTDAWNTHRSVEATGQKLSIVKTAHLSNKVKLALCAHTLLNGNQWFKRKQTALASFQLCWNKAHWCFKSQRDFKINRYLVLYFLYLVQDQYFLCSYPMMYIYIYRYFSLNIHYDLHR